MARMLRSRRDTNPMIRLILYTLTFILAVSFIAYSVMP
jgi:hypothetical protein